MSNKTPTNITEALQKFFSLHYSTKIKIKRSYDDWFWKQFWSDWKRKRTIQSQMLNLEHHTQLGSDLAVSKFVISKCGGLVRNHQGRWFAKRKDLPPDYSKAFKLTAIVVKETGLLTEGIDNFVGLDYLESLDLSDNKGLDDFACDQLSRQFRSSKSLKEVILNHNPLISIYGLEILFRIPSIKKISAIGTLAAEHEEIDLFTLAAEEERQCEIIVHGEGRRYKLPELEDLKGEMLQIAS